jgi:hypothetical protein
MKTQHVPCEVGTEVLNNAVVELENENSAAVLMYADFLIPLED